MANGTYLSDFRSIRGSGILPRFLHPSRLEGAPTRRYALSKCHWVCGRLFQAVLQATIGKP